MSQLAQPRHVQVDDRTTVCDVFIPSSLLTRIHHVDQHFLVFDQLHILAVKQEGTDADVLGQNVSITRHQVFHTDALGLGEVQNAGLTLIHAFRGVYESLSDEIQLILTANPGQRQKHLVF